ncbi:hypothetical protein [Paenibacillus andongensis]|uniref:hypothetical protein n=1 Tax=Paenibacillus andongensis TaxID=2975482 RepID=UPI0021BB0668|nr:hypothetical protein [Paenibacillus andongensis]
MTTILVVSNCVLIHGSKTRDYGGTELLIREMEQKSKVIMNFSGGDVQSENELMLHHESSGMIKKLI